MGSSSFLSNVGNVLRLLSNFEYHLGKKDAVFHILKHLVGEDCTQVASKEHSLVLDEYVFNKEIMYNYLYY